MVAEDLRHPVARRERRVDGPAELELQLVDGQHACQLAEGEDEPALPEAHGHAPVPDQQVHGQVGPERGIGGGIVERLERQAQGLGLPPRTLGLGEARGGRHRSGRELGHAPRW